MKRIKYKNTTYNINEVIRIPEYYKDNLKINKEDSFFIGTYVFLNDYLPNTLNRSPNTIISYRNCLRILKIFIEKTTGECFFNLKVKDATRILMLLFLKSIDEGGCITATRNQRLAGLKTYAKFMIGINFELADFLYCNILSIPMATAIKPEVGWIKREALQCIFEQTPENTKGRRDKIIMMLMYETAARASEILDLKISSLNLFDSGSSVRLHGKGNKTREIPIGKKITHLLNQYLDEYHKEKDPSGYLFFTLIHKRKNRMSIGNLERIVRKYSKLAREVDETVPIRVVPHMFRHSRATYMLSKNTPMVIIARFLGHVNLDSTSVYASCNVEMLREAIGKVEKDEPIMQEEATWEIDENQLALLCGLE